MVCLLTMSFLFACAAVLVFAGRLDPVESVEIGANREFRVNGEPFFPLMLWAQSLERLDRKLSIGVNTFAGRRGDANAEEFMDRLADAGAYAILHFAPEVPEHSHLLGWIQGDEPDLFRRDRAVEITSAEGTPSTVEGSLMSLMNGDRLRGPTFTPLQGAAFTVRPKEPLTACCLSLWLGADPSLSVAKEVLVEADGEEVLRAELQNANGEQRLALPKPTTFQELTIRVLSTYPGPTEAGRINLIGAQDEEGGSVFARLRVREPRVTADELAACYDRIKERDPMRPVLMTFTSNFMKSSTGFDEETKARIYPEYVKHCDVVGFDTYPVFGWNRPDQLHNVADGVAELCAIAGPRRPVYAWIEVNVGSRWIDPDKQKPLTPRDTRAEVWMAIIRGATAIGYFSHSWWPEYDEFAPDEDMMAELARLDAQITRLAPVILAEPSGADVAMSMSDELACHLKATEHEGGLYVFAQNMDMERRGGRATISVTGLAAGTQVEVVEEGRVVTADDGSFVDDFGPLAEHVYKVRIG